MNHQFLQKQSTSYKQVGWGADKPHGNFLFNELALCVDADYALFQSKGLGIINAAGVSMGLLTNDGPPEWHPASDKLKKICAAAGQYCKVRTLFAFSKTNRNQISVFCF
jgi:hypothetical protein